MVFDWLRVILEIACKRSRLSTFEIKLGLAKGLNANRNALKGLLETQSSVTSLVHWFALLNLVIDEDYEVRKEISQALMANKASFLLFRDLLHEAFEENRPEKVALVHHFYASITDQVMINNDFLSP